jgi:hypothetical protein
MITSWRVAAAGRQQCASTKGGELVAERPMSSVADVLLQAIMAQKPDQQSISAKR